jgi:hypothetical protein
MQTHMGGNGDIPSIFPFEESNESIFLIQMFQDKSNLPAHGGKRQVMGNAPEPRIWYISQIVKRRRQLDNSVNQDLLDLTATNNVSVDGVEIFLC